MILNDIIDFDMFFHILKKIHKTENLKSLQIYNFLYSWLLLRGYSVSNVAYTSNFYNGSEIYLLDTSPKLSLTDILIFMVDNGYIKRLTNGGNIIYEIQNKHEKISEKEI
jgi:hypothetical protein